MEVALKSTPGETIMIALLLLVLLALAGAFFGVDSRDGRDWATSSWTERSTPPPSRDPGPSRDEAELCA
jgi:hypothetical protein